MQSQQEYNRYTIPDRFREELEGYLYRGEPPSSFLSMVLQGDIRAVLVADMLAMSCIVNLVRYLDNEVSSSVWGSPDKIEKHLTGAHGQETK